jgi:hypothetical protein
VYSKVIQMNMVGRVLNADHNRRCGLGRIRMNRRMDGSRVGLSINH